MAPFRASPAPCWRISCATSSRTDPHAGTFCGSLAHADPASEWCLAAAALDATLVLRSASATRDVAARDYFQGVMTTALQPDEILVEARCPCSPDGTRFGFIEFSRRAGDFAIASVLATFRIVDRKIAQPRFAVGGAEAFPRRLAEVETLLDGAAPDDAAWTAAAQRASDIIEPLEDAATSGDYRRDLSSR